MSQAAERCLAGAIEALLATVPMAAVMIIGKRCLPRRSQDSLPPVQITQNALRAIDPGDELSRGQEVTLIAVNHFGFNASTCATFFLLSVPRSASNAVTSGCILATHFTFNEERGRWECKV